jgi:DNA-binding winged helix-turn-helix (wHTH) protein
VEPTDNVGFNASGELFYPGRCGTGVEGETNELRFSLVTDRSHSVCARFDRFQVDLSKGELRKDGTSVAIQEQPLQVLRMLLQADGEVVTREQLCSALWPKDTFVDFEHGVNNAVKKLRQALEDSAERPRFVETLPRIGYRFMVPVEWTNSRSGISLLPGVAPMLRRKHRLSRTRLRWRHRRCRNRLRRRR